MKQLEKMLIVTDFSSSSGNTIHTGARLARVFRSELFLAHVIPVVKEYPLVMQSLKNAVWGRLQEIEKRLGQQGIRVADTLVAVGSPFAEITKLAELLNVNVIVINAGDVRDGGRFVPSLTAERLVRAARQPVWLVKPHTRTPLRRILCPVDFSNPSRRALTNAVQLARAHQAELQVLTVIESLANICASTATVTLEAQQQYARTQHEEFKRFLNEIDFRGVFWTRTIRHGQPHHHILSVARASAADLVVMGSLGQTHLPYNWISSVAEQVLRDLPCSVIALKPQPINHWTEQPSVLRRLASSEKPDRSPEAQSEAKTLAPA